jgi:hypothetical protein
MSETTDHGINIADQIQCADAYGQMNDLTLADVWNILDQLFSHFIDIGESSTMNMIGTWMDKLVKIDEDLPL